MGLPLHPRIASGQRILSFPAQDFIHRVEPELRAQRLPHLDEASIEGGGSDVAVFRDEGLTASYGGGEDQGVYEALRYEKEKTKLSNQRRMSLDR